MLIINDDSGDWESHRSLHRPKYCSNKSCYKPVKKKKKNVFH